MSRTRARFYFCLAIALIAHALLLGWSSGTTLPSGRDLLAATRAVGPTSRPENASVTAEQDQSGKNRSSQRAAAARQPMPAQKAAETARSGHKRVTRFVMVNERAPDEQSAPQTTIDTPQPPQAQQIRSAARDARAQYLAGWQQRIEARGSRRYSRRLLEADQPRRLTMAVRVGADGALRGVRVLRPSGNEALDAAALAIVRGAAPYAPFDRDLAAITGELSFAYDWLFEPDGDTGLTRSD
jgi:protein TonB